MDNMKTEIKKMIDNYNRPHKETVAIYTEHIGDDNDYSCFLLDVIMKLYPVDPLMAWKLYRTDPMVIDNDISYSDFQNNIERTIKRHAEIKEMHKASVRAYAIMTN